MAGSNRRAMWLDCFGRRLIQAIVTSIDLEVCSALHAAFVRGCAGPRLEIKVHEGQGQQDPSESCTSLKAGSPC